MRIRKRDYYYDTDSDTLLARVRHVGECPMLDVDAGLYVKLMSPHTKMTKPEIFYLFGKGGALTFFREATNNDPIRDSQAPYAYRVDSATAKWLFEHWRYGDEGVESFDFDPERFDKAILLTESQKRGDRRKRV